MITIRTLLIYAIICFFSSTLYGSIDGEFAWVIVKNQNTDKPIEGVTVTINNVFVGETGALGKLRIPLGETDDVFAFYHTSYAARTFQRSQLMRMNYQVGLRQSVLNIQEVVIKANRVEQDNRKSAQEIRTIDAKRMSSQFQGNTADALALDPNVFIQKSQSGGGSPMIRGMSTSRILLLVDGIRMNNAIFRSGNVHNVISLDGTTISNMEITLGPGSVLHGSDAMGGVMHINTYDAHYGDSTEVIQSLVFDLSSHSSQLTRRPNFRLNYGGSNWAGMTSMTYSQFRDLRMGSNVHSWTPERHLSNTRIPLVPVSFGGLDTTMDMGITSTRLRDTLSQPKTSYEQRNLTHKLKFRINERSELKFGLYASQTSSVNRYDRFSQTDLNGRPKYAVWNYGPQFWAMSFLAFENRSKTKYTDWFKITASTQGFQESRIVRKYKNMIGRDQTEQMKIAQLNMDASKELSDKFQIIYGSEIIVNSLRSNGKHFHSLNPDSTWEAQSRYADGSTWNSASVFLSTNYDISSSMALSSGVRVNKIAMFTPIEFNGFQEDAQLNFLAPSGSLGLTYYKPNFKYFINLSTGFRAPNIDDASKVFDSQPGFLIVPNTDLREERLYSSEVGMKQKLNQWLALDASFYYSYLNNVMLRAPFEFQGSDSIFYDGEFSQILAVQNLDYAWIWGYQFGLRSELSKRLFWTVHWSHPFGRDSQGETLRHVNPFNATSQIVYHRKKWSCNLTLRYNGEVAPEDMPFSERSKLDMYAINDLGQAYSPAWYTMNIQSTYEVNKNIVLRVGMENLMNIKYRPYSSGISAPGRSVFIALRGSI